MKTAMEKLIAASIRLRDAHRKEYNDTEWLNWQRFGPPIYMKGDIVQFKVGGIGIIEEVSWRPETGNPPSYSAGPIDGRSFHFRNVCAWHYEGDIESIVKLSAIRSL